MTRILCERRKCKNNKGGECQSVKVKTFDWAEERCNGYEFILALSCEGSLFTVNGRNDDRR